MREHVSILAAMLLLASGAEAAAWRKGCTSTGATTSRIAIGESVCAYPSSASDDTDVLTTLACENFDLEVYADDDGNGTGAAALTAQLQLCPRDEANLDTDAEQDAACVNLGSTHTGTGASLGAAGDYAKVRVGGTHAGDPKYRIRCNGAMR